MPTLKLVSGSPLSVTYRNPEALNMQATVTAKIQPVKREKATYNHIKKSIRIADVIRVEGVCKDACLTSPVVLELSWSAPEGVSSDVYKKLLDQLITSNGGASGVFVTGPAELTVS